VTTSPVTWIFKPFPQRHRLGRTHSRAADKRVLWRCQANQSGRSLGYFSHGPRHIFRWKGGACSGRWSSPRPQIRRGLYEESGGGKWRERVVGKAARNETSKLRQIRAAKLELDWIWLRRPCQSGLWSRNLGAATKISFLSAQGAEALIGSNDPKQKHWSRQDAATEEAKTEQWRSRGLFV
jgi:hypothetical protein